MSGPHPGLKATARLILPFALTFCLAQPPVAGAARPEPAAEASQTYSFSFQDADIAAVASEILGSTLNIPYSIDPGVTGKMSLRIAQRLTRIQLLEAFEAALAANGIALVHQGDSLILEPPSKARVSAGLRTLEGGGVHQAGYQVLAVPLTFATPSEIAKILESVAPANTVVYANDKLGLLILGGSAKELQSALDTIKVFDRDDLEDAKVRWFTLRQAAASTVASDLEKVVQAAGLSGVTIVPLKRLNGLVAFSRSPAALEMVAKWIERLDQGVGSNDGASNLWVYHPRNVSAEALRTTLTSLFFGSGSLGGASGAPAGVRPSVQAPDLAETSSAAQAQAGEPPPGSGINGPPAGEDAVRFGVDKESNTLLVSAPLARWTGIERLLNEIDRPPRQVMIEASILEVTLTRDFHFGVDWSVLGSAKRLKVQEVGNADGVIGPSYPGLSATFLSGTIQAAVTALGAHSDVEVISAPKIVALDNHVAKLEVGDQVPIITQSSQSTVGSNSPIVNSVDYRNTGVILNVTPRISGDNKIVLDIAQEVSSVAQTTTSGINSPTIQERKLESTLVLPDGGVVALGGLISSNKTKSIAGIPFIEDAPVIGSLFRGDTRSTARTELIVLLTTRILPDVPLSGGGLSSLAADMAEIKGRGLLDHRP